MSEQDREIRTHRPEWAMIVNRCVCVVLTIKHWSANAKLSAEDLGLQHATPEFRELIGREVRLGRFFLMPEERIKKFHSLAVGTRLYCLSVGIPSPLGYLIPKTRYLEWRERMDRYEFEFSEMVAETIMSRDTWIEEMVTQYRPAFRHRVSADGIDPDSNEGATRIERMAEDFRYLVPNTATLQKKFMFQWSPVVIEGFGDTEEAKAEAARLQALAEDLDAQIKARTERIASLTSEERLAEQIELSRLEVERKITQDHLERRTQIWEDQFSQIVKGVAGKAHEIMFGLCERLLNHDEEAPALSQRQVNQLRAVIEELRTINLSDDPEFTRMEESLQDVLGAQELAWDDPSKAEEARMQAQKVLRHLSTIAYAGLVELDRAPKKPPVSFDADIELDIQTSRARRELGFDVLPSTTIVTVDRATRGRDIEL